MADEGLAAGKLVNVSVRLKDCSDMAAWAALDWVTVSNPRTAIATTGAAEPSASLPLETKPFAP